MRLVDSIVIDNMVCVQGVVQITCIFQGVVLRTSTSNTLAYDVVKSGDVLDNEYYDSVDEAREELIKTVIMDNRYIIRTSESGIGITSESDYSDALDVIDVFELDDKNNDEFKEGYYEIYDLVDEKIIKKI